MKINQFYQINVCIGNNKPLKFLIKIFNTFTYIFKNKIQEILLIYMLSIKVTVVDKFFW